MAWLKSVADTMRNTALLGAEAPSGQQDALVRTYLRMKLKQTALATRRGQGNGGPRVERVLGWSVACFDYPALVDLFEEIFVNRHYVFEASCPRPLILDCGSNIGMSVLFFKWLYPGCEIIAFEPDPETFTLLGENVSANGLTGVRLVSGAVCDREGPVDFYVDPDRPGSLLMSMRQARLPKQRVEVSGTRLSGYVDRPVDLLKMDIEGAEELVIRDLVDQGKLTLVREMIFEFHHHIDPRAEGLGELLRVLEQHGFGYQLLTPYMTGFQTKGAFQDVLVHAYRS
jgi:FkbM family methyltransferase